MIRSFDEFLAEATSGGDRGLVLVRVDKPSGGDEQFLYVFPVAGIRAFKKGLKMVHFSQRMDCWRVVMKDGSLACSKAMWPKMMTGNSLVLNDDTKTPLHWVAMKYNDPHKLVRENERVLLAEKNIDWR
jgi:hypothetical protein